MIVAARDEFEALHGHAEEVLSEASDSNDERGPKPAQNICREASQMQSPAPSCQIPFGCWTTSLNARRSLSRRTHSGNGLFALPLVIAEPRNQSAPVQYDSGVRGEDMSGRPGAPSIMRTRAPAPFNAAERLAEASRASLRFLASSFRQASGVIQGLILYDTSKWLPSVIKKVGVCDMSNSLIIPCGYTFQ